MAGERLVVCIALHQGQREAQREHRQRSNAQCTRRLATLHFGRQPGSDRGQHQQRVHFGAVREEAGDLMDQAAQPPQQAPQVIHQCDLMTRPALVAPRRREAGQGQQQRANGGRVDQEAQVFVPVVAAGNEGECSADLQQRAGDLR